MNHSLFYPLRPKEKDEPQGRCNGFDRTRVRPFLRLLFPVHANKHNVLNEKWTSDYHLEQSHPDD